MAGIVGYGAFVPRNRITSEEIANQWGKNAESIKRGLLLEEKSVPGLDEDTITISVAAGRSALARETVVEALSRAHSPWRRAEALQILGVIDSTVARRKILKGPESGAAASE